MNNNSNSTTAAPNCGSVRQRLRLRRDAGLVIAAAAGAAMLLGPARRAAAFFFDPIIFDPSALVEHVQQVVQLGQQIKATATQVKNGLKELAHLRNGVAPDDVATVSGFRSELDAAVYDVPDPANQLNAQYPTAAGETTWAQRQADETAWNVNERQALVENRQVQNKVGQDMDATRQQVRQVVDASNAAPGETAAAQAHNDLLAIASGELSKLETLRIARSRLRTDRLAQDESESAYATAERSRVRSGWSDPTPPSGTVADPFQD